MEILLIKENFMRIANYIFSFFIFMASCQSPKDQEKFKWNAGISSPKYYSAAPFVEYFYQGKSVAGASTNIGVGQGWGITMGGYTGGDIFKPVPDSVFVKWSCGVDDILYEGGYKLPRKKMIQLFRKGAVNPNNAKIDDYTLLVGGTAPGGNVTIWMKAGQVITEIVKFKAHNKGIWMKGNIEYHKLMKEIKNSKEYINSETSIYLYLHGVPYSVWEKGEKKYDYDIGFSSEDGLVKPKIVTINSTDGSWYQSWTNKASINSIDIFKWENYNYLENNNLKRQEKLPVQIDLKWKITNQDKMMHGILVMPQNLEELVSKPYINSISNKTEYYNRIIITSYKGGGKGILWLTGKNKKIKLMEFIMLDSEDKNIKSYYSLPKGFVFPKWEGREPLKTPEIEYWQEK
ncbi:MAG: DUF2931 family protein [Flavobacterium sp.]